MTTRKNQIALELLLETNADLAKYKVELDRLADVLKKHNRKNAAEKNKLSVSDHKKTLKQFEKLEKTYLDKRLKAEKNYSKNIGKSAVSEFKKTQKTYVAKWKQAFETVTRYASAGALIFKGLEIGKEVVKEFFELELAIDRVGVITNSTSEEASRLTDSIYGMGIAFGVSTQDATQFTIEMSKLGKTVAEIEGLSIQAAGLSVILGEDLATSGRLMVTTMNQFGLATDEAARVSSTFFNTIRTSPIGVKDLQTSLQYVGSAAYAAGLEVEEVGAMIGRLSELGLRASKIGTGMRNVILKLSQDSRGFSVAMEEMSERGVSLTEAVERFGVRGALAGYNLIKSWQDLKTEIEDRPIVPDSNFIWESLRTTTNLVTDLSRAWQQLKAFLTGNTFEDPLEEMRDLSRALESIGVEITDLPLKVSQAMKEIAEAGGDVNGVEILNRILSPEDVKEWEDSLSKNRSLASPVFDFLYNLAGIDTTPSTSISDSAAGEQISKGIEKIAEGIENEKTVVEELRVASENYKNVASKALTDIAKGIIDNQTGVERVEAAQKDYRKALVNIRQGSPNESKSISQYRVKVLTDEIIDQKAANALQAELSRLAGKSEDYDKKRALELYKSLTERRKALEAGIKSGDIKRDEATRQGNALDDEESSLCAFFKLAGMDICNPEKQKKEFEDFKQELRHFFDVRSSEVDRLIAELEADDQSLSSIKSNSLQDLMSFAKFQEGNADLSKREAYDAYRKYTKDYLEGVREAIDAEYVSQLSDIQTSKELREANLNQQLLDTDAAIKLAEEAGDDKQVEELKRMYMKYYQSLLDVQADAENEVTKLNQKRENAQQDVNTKENNMASFVPDKDEMKDKLKQYANYLNEVIDIYRQFADEMDAQRNAAFDRDKENVENRYSFEKDVLKDASDHNLITAEQYAKKSKQLELKKIDDTNAIAKKQFEANKKADLRNAALEGTANAAKALAVTTGEAGALGIPAGVAAAALVAAQTAVAVAAISQRQYAPLRFADGGKVEGRSHAQGGIPFTVSGQGGYEMEGGEYVIKKSSVNANTLPLLDAINNDTRYNPTHFANGGQIESPSTTPNEPTIVRAYVTEKDLDAYERNKLVRTSNKNLF